MSHTAVRAGFGLGRFLAALTAAAVLLPASLSAQSRTNNAPAAPPTDIDPAGAGVDIPAYDSIAGEQSLDLRSVRLDALTAVDLSLRRLEPFSSSAAIVMGGPSGDTPIATPSVALFAGHVRGNPRSRAFLGISPFGTYGFVEHSGRTYVISSGPAGQHWPTKLADLAAFPAWADFECHTDELPLISQPPPAADGGIASTPPCRVLDIAVETDYEFTQNLFGGDTAASAAYAATLMGAVSAIYTRDLNVRVQITYLRLWTTSDDPWTQPDAGSQLTEFLNYWNANMGGVYRHLAHFLSARGLGGGVAYLSAVCNGTYGYGLSGNIGGFFPYPLQHNNGANWDVMVVAHEIGHNVGAPHTHSMTPPVDCCGGGAACGDVQDCTNADQGTIMSYCHTCSPGMANMRLEFHPRTIDETILPYLDATCSLAGDPLDGHSLNFDGASGYVAVPAFGQVAPTTEVTVELWVYADVSGRYAFGMSPDNGGSRFRARIPWSDGKVYWDFGDTSGGQLSYAPPQSITGSWQHFAFVASQSGNTMQIYRNGVLEASKVGMVPYVQGAFDLRLGARGPGSFFDGRLDEIRIWNVARSPAQIAAAYQSTLAGDEPGLFAYWRFDDGAGATAADSAGSHPGTVSGASWVPAYPCSGDTGACCFVDGSCLNATQGDCGYFGGTYQGDGTNCETDGCPPFGACCLTGAGGACALMFANDCSAAGGTFHGAAAPCTGTGPFTGSSLHFNGANAYCQIANAAALNFSGPITVEAWIKPTTSSGVRNIMVHGYRTNPNAETGIRINNGYYEAFSWDGATHGVSFPVPPADVGSWVHVAGMHDGAAWRLYRNGVLVAQSADPVGALTMNSKWSIGSRGNGQERFFKGQIDEVRVWNVARAQSEIAANMLTPPAQNSPGFVGYWRLDDGSGATAVDMVGGNAGTVVNADWTPTEPCAVACAPCDANCDGSVNPFDINAFLALLGSSPPAGCSPCAGDINADGSVNPFDIQAFLGCFGG